MCSIWGSSCTSSFYTISQRNGTFMHLKFHLSLFDLRFSFLHICIICLSIVSWLLPFSLYPKIRILCVIPNKFGRSLNIFSSLHWNMFPTAAVPNGSLAYLYQLTSKCCWWVSAWVFQDQAEQHCVIVFWHNYKDIAAVCHFIYYSTIIYCF